MTSSIILASAQLAEESHHVVNELPIPAIWFGVIMFLALMGALLAIMSMRSVSMRLPEPTTAVQHRGPSGSRSAGH